MRERPTRRRGHFSKGDEARVTDFCQILSKAQSATAASTRRSLMKMDTLPGKGNAVRVCGASVSGSATASSTIASRAR